MTYNNYGPDESPYDSRFRVKITPTVKASLLAEL